jgi:Ca2+-binding RTX toxin-like protein
MRRLLMVLALVAVFMPLSARAAVDCTQTGTAQRDKIEGTPHRDKLCARGGDDYARGDDAADIILGGGGGDTLVGSDGADRLVGGLGADELFATDGTPNDTVDCGPGRDRAYGDQGDSFTNCEHVRKV